MKRVVLEFHYGSVTSTHWFVCPEPVNSENEAREKCVNAEQFVKEWLDKPPKTHRKAIVEVPENSILAKVRHTSRGNVHVVNFNVAELKEMEVLPYI